MTTAVEDPDVCLWCHARPATCMGFCADCVVRAFSIPNPTDPPRDW